MLERQKIMGKTNIETDFIEARQNNLAKEEKVKWK